MIKIIFIYNSMENITEKQIALFKSRIAEPNENGCMLWMASKDKDGYGRICFTINKIEKKIAVHRLALWLVEKPENDKLLACHKPIVCHTRDCCNPEHLYWGTLSDNAKDKIIDGYETNFKNGSQNPRSKLSEEQVKEIKQLLNNGNLTQKEIAEKFGVVRQHISKIKNGKIWGHLTL